MMVLRYAWRSLNRSRVFVLVATVALGIGLGLSTTMFAVLDTIRNPVASFENPTSVVMIGWRIHATRSRVSQEEFARLLREQIAAVGPATWTRYTRVAIQDKDIGQRPAARVAPDYFTVTGTGLRLGRPFGDTDGDDAVIVGDGLWRAAFGNRRDLDGATLTIDGQPRQVIGVVRPGATIPWEVSVWLPEDPAADLEALSSAPIVRLPAGMTYLQALGVFSEFGKRLTASHGSREAPIAVWAMPGMIAQRQVKESHAAMTGAAVFVLILACINLAHLMLARGMARRRELAVRLAIGATRRVIVWQMFLECALITLGGIVLGALVSVWGLDVLNNRVPPEVPTLGMLKPSMSWRVFAGSALAALLSAVAFGLVPAIRVALNVSLDEPLKDGAGTTGRNKGRYSALVIAEVALALTLIMGGGLLLRTIQQLRRVEYTFDARTLLEAYVWQPTRLDSASMRYTLRDTTQRARRDALTGLAAAVPGARAAAYAWDRELPGGAITAELSEDSTRTINSRTVEEVSWQYLRVFGLSILEGRDFEPGDAAGSGAAIINPVTAQRLYRTGPAVGRMLKLGAPDRDAPWIPIIGIARSPAVLRGGEDPVGPMVWIVGPDRAVHRGALFVRAERDDPSLPGRLRERIRTSPPFQSNAFKPYSARRDGEIRAHAFFAKVFVAMGCVALFIAALGLYSVLAYAVNERMREFAVRIALGAQARQLFRMVMNDAAVMVLAGIGVGAFAAMFTSTFLNTLLSDVVPSDVLTLVLSELVLLGAGFLAAMAPARRALRANPVDILRAN